MVSRGQEKPDSLIKVTQAGPRTQTSGYRGLPHSAPPGQGAVSPAALPQCRTERAVHTHSVTRGLTRCRLLSPKPAQFTRLGYKHLESREVRKSRYKIMLRVAEAVGGRWASGACVTKLLAGSLPPQHTTWSPVTFSPRHKEAQVGRNPSQKPARLGPAPPPTRSCR